MMAGATRRYALFEQRLFSLGRPEWLAERVWPWRMLIAWIAAAGAIHGAAMGMFRLDSAERIALVAYSAIKVPVLILLTTAIVLPAYFILNTILGLREDFARALRAVLFGQAGLALALASLAPFTMLAYASGVSHGQAQLFGALMFAIATGLGQVVLLRHYRPLIAGTGERGHRHRLMLWAWVVLYAFVGIQLGWILRPYIGVPGMPVQFFREDAFSNAYTYFLRLALRGGASPTRGASLLYPD